MAAGAGRSFMGLQPGYVFRSTAIITSASLTLFAAKETMNGNEKFYREYLMPTVQKLIEPEMAHFYGVQLAKFGYGFAKTPLGEDHKELLRTRIEAWDWTLDNPIGLAAGFDKDADAIGHLRSSSGLGFVEAGTVTPLPQPGNPKPRVFRLEKDKAVINRYGFNSSGHGTVLTRMKAEWDATDGGNDSRINDDKNIGVEASSSYNENNAKLGINLGKNKDSTEPKLDYSVGVALIGPFADYIVINVSSPNTKGLRDLQSKRHLREIMLECNSARSRISSREKKRLPRLFLKIAPDLDEEGLKDIAAVVKEKKCGIDGLIVSNTTISRPSTLQSDRSLADEAGGLSGAPLRTLSTECIRQMYRLTNGKVPIIGCGGVFSGEDAYEKIRAGASLVQIYTAITYEGFPVVRKIQRELAECLQRDGFTNVTQAIALDHRQKEKKS